MPGQTATMSCSATGDPRPQLRWLRNAAAINTEDPRVSVGPNSELTIQAVTLQDAGEYVCEAFNGVTETQRKIVSLTVEGK